MAAPPPPPEWTSERHRMAGDAAMRHNRFAQAIESYDYAIRLAPGDADAHRGRAIACLKTGDVRGALAAAMRATTLAPDNAGGWVDLARVFAEAGSPDLAASAYAKAATLRPDRADLKGQVLHQRLMAADWRDLDAGVAAVERALAAGEAAIHPFCWQALSASPRSLQMAALRFERHEPAARARPVFAARRPGPIRIGYVSGEFHEQATAMLMAGVYERHDRTRFAITGFDNGVAGASSMRRRLGAAFDRMVAIRHLDTDATVDAVRAADIDILVNLNGYFGEARGDVFRHRAAPVQVNYLGFPGTVGNGYMDYIVADRIVIPDAETGFYSEKIVRLPHCYQANDDTRPIGDSPLGRADHGLPRDGFVFACFNNSYKILPSMFDIWARILDRVADSVLWLIDDNPAATRNLRREAAARGLDPARLIFAPRVAPAAHLARHRHADLFLDTSPYGAHTTASDALWSGLPVLTLTGTTFPGRVATSLLHTLGLPELIASSRAEYERKAVSLAHDRSALARIATRLADRRRSTPLFDTARFTADLERAYTAVYRRFADGLPPAAMDIPASRTDATRS